MNYRDDRVDISIEKVWGDAWAVYKLLFRRSVLTAAIVYALVDGVRSVSDELDRHSTSIALSLAYFVLIMSGPVLVQGALVEIVRNIHEGQKPESVSALLRRALGRLHSLIWASTVYGFGVFFGLLLLIVPGLIAAARWCLMAPLIMLERENAGNARRRSREFIMPYTWPVFWVILAALVATTVVSGGASSYVSFGNISPFEGWLIRVAASSVTAPFAAHVLTVIYYRITDPEHPVIHPDVRTWRSVWETT